MHIGLIAGGGDLPKYVVQAAQQDATRAELFHRNVWYAYEVS